MPLMTSNLLRSFAVGFVLGAAVVVVTIGHQKVTNLGDQVFPPAIAAPER